MKRPLVLKRTAILVLAAASLTCAVAACGKQSDLDRPGPMWGPKARADDAAQKRAKAAASNRVQGSQDPPIDTFTQPDGVTARPIPGEHTLPSSQPPGSETGQSPQSQ
jgi:hypothetical protein